MVKKNEEMLSVIVPAYNEENTIYENLKELDGTLGLFRMPYEIVIVDDGSSDSTLKRISSFAESHHHAKVLSYENNSGKGNAILTGIDAAEGTLIAFIDADLEIHPMQIKSMIYAMKKENADVVIGSKRHERSRVNNYPPSRSALSHFYHTMTNILFGLNMKDTQAGLKLFKAEVLRKIRPVLLVKRYAFDLEMLVNAKINGYKIIEAPIVVNFKRKFQRIRFEDIYAIWIDTFAIFYRAHILSYYQKEYRKKEQVQVVQMK